MANIADCTIVIYKKDLDKLGGAIRPAKEGEKTYTCYKATCTDKSGNKHTIVEEDLDGWKESNLILDGKKITLEEFRDKGFLGIQWETISNQVVDNGWFLDWKALNGYSYQGGTYIQGYPELLRIDFNGRWNFPEELENTLNKSGVEWQGAALDDAMDWQTTELGNSDFGLQIVDDDDPYGEDEDGNEVYGHHIELLQENYGD